MCHKGTFLLEYLKLNHSFDRKLSTYLLKSIIFSPNVSSENPMNNPSDPPMSPKREENGYKIDSSFTVRLMLEYAILRPELFVLSRKLLIKSFNI